MATDLPSHPSYRSWLPTVYRFLGLFPLSLPSLVTSPSPSLRFHLPLLLILCLSDWECAVVAVAGLRTGCQVHIRHGAT